MPHTIFVTGGPISDPDAPFFKALGAALDHLGAQGFAFAHDEQPPRAGYDCVGFVDRARDVRVEVWEDYEARVQYVVIAASDTARLAAVRDAVYATVKPPSVAQLIARARRARSDPTSLMRAVYAAVERPADARVQALVQSALGHAHPQMRATGAYAARVLARGVAPSGAPRAKRP